MQKSCNIENLKIHVGFLADFPMLHLICLLAGLELFVLNDQKIKIKNLQNKKIIEVDLFRELS